MRPIRTPIGRPAPRRSRHHVLARAAHHAHPAHVNEPDQGNSGEPADPDPADPDTGAQQPE